MSNPSGEKGTKWETAVVNFLTLRGLPARRKAKSGSKDKADVEIDGLPGIVIEAKNCKRDELAAFVDEAAAEAANAGAQVGVVWHHRRLKASPGGGFVTMSGDHFVNLAVELLELHMAVRRLESDVEWYRSH